MKFIDVSRVRKPIQMTRRLVDYNNSVLINWALLFIILLAPNSQSTNFMKALECLLSGAKVNCALPQTILSVALTPEENCQYCQRILYFSYNHFKKQTTKRFLRHKINHLCKRYYDVMYRRHCLMSIQPRIEVIRLGMEHAMLAGHYKPWNTCKTIKECDNNQSPIEFKELVRAIQNEREMEAESLDDVPNHVWENIRHSNTFNKSAATVALPPDLKSGNALTLNTVADAGNVPLFLSSSAHSPKRNWR